MDNGLAVSNDFDNLMFVIEADALTNFIRKFADAVLARRGRLFSLSEKKNTLDK